MKMCSDDPNKVKIPHMNMCSEGNDRVGTSHIKVFSYVDTRVEKKHMKMCSDVLTKAGTPHTYTGMLGHSTYFVEGRSNWGGDTAQHRLKLGEKLTSES